MNQGRIGFSLKTEINHHFLFTGATLKLNESCKYLEPWKDSVSLFWDVGFHGYIQKSRYDAAASQIVSALVSAHAQMARAGWIAETAETQN